MKKKRNLLSASWMQMNKDERFVFNKLLTGNFRIGVSQKMMVNALAKTVQLRTKHNRTPHQWQLGPATISFDDLLSNEGGTTDYSKPYPFYLAYALEGEVE